MHIPYFQLMSKFIRLLGKDIAERILMKRFIELCSSHLFYVRKLAAWQFGHYCAIVGTNMYEQSLVSLINFSAYSFLFILFRITICMMN